MTLDRAIRLAQEWVDGGICFFRKGEAQEYNKLVLDTLRAQADAGKNEPLTLEELREMDGEPVWCVSLIRENAEWALVHIIEISDMWFISVSGASCGYGDKDTYGRTWFAYRRKKENL